MKASFTSLVIGCLVALASCTNPAEEHRLSAEQLAWQGYQDGQVLRFAQRPAGPVRTYRITGISDQLERQPIGGNFTLLPSRKIDCQHLAVTAQRTDTAAAVSSMVLNFAISYSPVSSSPSQDFPLWAVVSWERFYGADRLPLDEINKGLAFDTLQYPGVKLLPSATFGGVAYAPVIRLAGLYAPPAGSTQKAIQMLYYAKNKGVVAYEEAGALWYRLP